MRRWILRLIAWLFVGVVVATALLAGAIRLDQYLLRWRAERLQVDIRSLELRKSTYADARRIINLWWSDAHEKGPCRPDWCDVEISLTDFAWTRGDFIWRTRARFRVFLWLGARPAIADASIRVRKNAVTGKTINAHVGGPCHDFDSQTLCLTVIAHAETGEHRFIDPRHPEYSFSKPSGCEYCVDAHVIFSPYADAEDVRRLTDLNFRCITRWRPCETETDILPTAWDQLHREGTLPEIENNCSDTVRALSRGLNRLPLASVLAVTDIGEGPQLTVKWDERAERTREDRPNSFAEPKGIHVRKGDRILVFEGYLFSPFNACGIVPASKENLRMARQGLSEDLSDHVDALKLFFGEIHPPHIDVH
ncbi:MAG TPA: hypothetical protein VGS27_17325 [Candidatus Sulfotelmatobacter sp.]|nr:hypothetical protein [Candidatus Sulfotelmatobacter sp.]